VERVREFVADQEEFLAQQGEEERDGTKAFMLSLLQLDLERVNFLIRSYLRTRSVKPHNDTHPPKKHLPFSWGSCWHLTDAASFTCLVSPVHLARVSQSLKLFYSLLLFQPPFLYSLLMFDRPYARKPPTSKGIFIAGQQCGNPYQFLWQVQNVT